MKNTYELGYWLNIESETKSDLERIKNILKKYEAEILFEEIPQKRNLAYPIKKQKLGYFGYLIFELEKKENLEKINEELKNISSILRFIIIKRKILLAKETKIIETNL
ncbi:MAG: hypothetical protein KatS3mg095_0104 [Candidatus Parcubacteria bacterium]|nr:MAG: hypothetical protein KatS3mg095_0104 [Candidatus Parcubacteria bacterium]